MYFLVFGITKNNDKRKSFSNWHKKHFFNFIKMIYGFKNRKSFSEFKFFIITRTFVGICHRWSLKFVGNSNCRRRSPDFGIQSPKSGDIGWIPATVAEIRRPPLESSHCCRILATAAKIQSLLPNFSKLDFSEIGQNSVGRC